MSKLMEIVLKKLEENDFMYAEKLLNDKANESELKKCVRDLVPVLAKNVGKNIDDDKNDLMVCSGQLLEIIALKADPEEVVLEFLEQMDNADCIKFSFILKLLFICLERCTENKMRYIETCLVTIRSCLEDVIQFEREFVVEDVYEDEIRVRVKDISLVLESVLDFYGKFITKISAKATGYDSDGMVNLFLSRLLQMFDFYLPFDDSTILLPLNNAKIHTLNLIDKLMSNPFSLLEPIFLRNVRQQNNLSEKDKINYETANLRMICDDVKVDHLDENLSLFENDYVISDLGYAVFFYTILCSGDGLQMQLPAVYNPKFIFLSLAPLSISFLDKSPNSHVIKGLKFLQTLLDYVKCIKLERMDLFFQFHEKILAQLNHTMIYSEHEDTRKVAVTCYKKYVDIFDFEAKYYILINIRPSIEHSGTLGLLITLLKECIGCFIDTEPLMEFGKYYNGKLLYDLFSQYCYLASGENTDLVVNADQIISSLNLLRFVLLKDKMNKTGLRNYLTDIDEKFLQPLKEGIDVFKKVHKLKMDELAKNVTVQIPKNRVELTVNGQTMDISNEQQQSALFSSVNAVELIESLLDRVEECIGDNADDDDDAF